MYSMRPGPYHIKLIDLSGRVFGRLTAIDCWSYKRYMYTWKCLCSCGSECFVSRTHLLSGHTKSCGCIRSETSRAKATTHGLADSPEYRIWSAMKKRCSSPRDAGWKNYGGRGISVCESWIKFENFFSDMGHRPPGLMLERINNDGNYEPSNCKWATRSEQMKNRHRWSVSSVKAHQKTE